MPTHALHFLKPSAARLIGLAATLSVGLGACNGRTINVATNADKTIDIPAYRKLEDAPGGATSVPFAPIPRLDLPAANLATSLKANFYAGRALAEQPWLKAPATTDARDGLGPLYNARTCMACHRKGGKGQMPDDSQTPLFSALVHLSLPRSMAGLAMDNLPEPTYGLQLQSQSTSLAHQLRHHKEVHSLPTEVAPEGYAYVEWREHSFTYNDQQQIALRSPKLVVRQLAYGAMHPDTEFSLRVAPAIHGMGLIESIPQASIDALADAEDSNRDGISGRVNWVWDASRGIRAPGRFGLKANRAFLDTTVASAFGSDLGISNPLSPSQPCTINQARCLAETNGNNVEKNGHQGFELSADLLSLVVEFNRHLGVPFRRNPTSATVQQGRSLFYGNGCASCHHPAFVTKTSTAHPALSEQIIWPYSDFLLHDMGADLADNRRDQDATGREWRTPPLWGLGLNEQVSGSCNLLHDGRARSVEEAILWHAGEAEASRDAFVKLNAEQRQNLIAFVRSL